MNSPPSSSAVVSSPPHRAARLRWLLEVVILAALILVFHYKSVSHGLFMDDHPHFRQLREADWSLGGLTAACRLELFGNYCNAWWMPDVTLRFFRPVSFAVMKLTYVLSGWNPAALHAASLCWHLTACVLIVALLRRINVDRTAAFVAGALFAIHPAHVATIEWIAAQTELMVTVFLLGATLCWAQVRGWPFDRTSGSLTRRLLSFLACLALFAAALGCRENAIMFPFVMLAADPVLFFTRRATRAASIASNPTGATQPGRLAIGGMYAALAVIAAIYLVVRSSVLGGVALPPRPYVYPLTDPGFIAFVLDKAGYYLLGEFLLAPCVPFAGVLYLREHAATFYALLAAVLILMALATWLARARLIGWLAPVWLLAFMLPVLPSFESPHHLYLPGVGWAMTVAILGQSLRQRGGAELPSAANTNTPPPRRVVYWLASAGLAGVLATVTYYNALTIDTAQRVEDNLVDELASADPPLRDGETVYIANLPLVTHYVRLPVEERLGLHNLRVVALTWSPRLLGMATPAELTWIDDHTIEMRVAEDRWFAGPLGYLARAASGEKNIGGPEARQFLSDVRGETLQTDPEGGISALRIHFAQPIGVGGTRLFWGSRVRWAFEVRPPLTP